MRMSLFQNEYEILRMYGNKLFITVGGAILYARDVLLAYVGRLEDPEHMKSDCLIVAWLLFFLRRGRGTEHTLERKKIIGFNILVVIIKYNNLTI